MAARRRVERSILVPGPVELVWRAIGDHRALERWLLAPLELEVRPGARGWAGRGPSRRHVRVEAVEPPRRLVLTWWPAREDASLPPSRVEVLLEPAAADVRVRVAETVLADLAASARPGEVALATAGP